MKDQALRRFIVDTPLPVSFVAQMAGMNAIRALNILQQNAEKWSIKLTRSRIDGHNPVWLVQNLQRDFHQFRGLSFSMRAADIAREQNIQRIKQMAELCGLSAEVTVKSDE